MPMQISGVTIQGGMNILPRAGAPSPTPSPTPGPSDPDFSNVVFMFDGDGTDGGANNTFTDASTNGHTITEIGDVTQGSFSPYGDNWSNYCGATEYIAASDSAIAMGTGNWTLEFWVHFNSINNGTIKYLFDWRTASDTTASILVQETSGSWTWWNGSGSNLDTGSLSSSTFSVGTWHHVALSRSGSSLRLFVDGVVIANPSDSSNYSSTTITVGNRYTGNYNSDAYFSNVRIVKGTALYTSAFTPPTEPLTAVTNTVLLTCQSNRFVDESTTNSTITVGGTPKVTPFSPFAPTAAYSPATRGGSGLFATGDGTTNNLTATVNAIGTNNFTIEMWLYNTEQNNQPILDLGGYQDGISIRYDQTGTDRISGYIKGGDLTYVNDPTPNQWVHFALTRSGSTVKAFYNGIQTLSTTNSSDLTRTNLKIGGINSGGVGGNDSYTGYMSDVRIVIGDALYTTDFTPPTAPLTAVTNTELLLNFQDSAIYDYSGQNNIDTVGDAQIDTAIKKYGTGSVKFDGTGDYLDITESTELVLGTGDFTIEFWINTSNDGNIMNPKTATGSGYWGLLMQSGNLRWNNSYNVANLWEISASAIQDGSWHHVAISRASGSTKIFYDGTLHSTQTDTTDYSGTGAWRIGSGNLAAFNGYLDDFRITKGIARYTTNFTPPTAALPKF